MDQGLCRKKPLLLESGNGFRSQGWIKKFKRLVAISEVLKLVGRAATILIVFSLINVVCIIAHESGHLLAAYLRGIVVSEFVVGSGPILAKFTSSNNVTYSLRAFPTGGHVTIDLLEKISIFDRVLVASAGVVANTIFAYVIVLVQVLVVGLVDKEAYPGVVVAKVTPLSASSRDIGLLPGDVILGFNSNLEFVGEIKKNPKTNILLKIGRGEENIEVNVTPDDTGRIVGVQLLPNVKYSKARPKDLLQVFRFSGRQFCSITTSNVMRKINNPDWIYIFGAFMNLLHAAPNILPLPGRDGGNLVVCLVKAVRGGPLQFQQQIMLSGTILLILILGILCIVRDTFDLYSSLKTFYDSSSSHQIPFLQRLFSSETASELRYIPVFIWAFLLIR